MDSPYLWLFSHSSIPLRYLATQLLGFHMSLPKLCPGAPGPKKILTYKKQTAATEWGGEEAGEVKFSLEGRTGHISKPRERTCLQLAYSLTQEKREAVMGTTEQGSGDGIPERGISGKWEKCGPMGRWLESGEVSKPRPSQGFLSPVVLWQEDGAVALRSDVNSQGI